MYCKLKFDDFEGDGGETVKNHRESKITLFAKELFQTNFLLVGGVHGANQSAEQKNCSGASPC